ncbi:MAG: histidine kinase [Acidovorax sp.]|jgi:signal transduction histidine kinase|nr:histidine kinase [Acidovorax sp.]
MRWCLWLLYSVIGALGWATSAQAETATPAFCAPRILSVHAQRTTGESPPPADPTAGDWTPVQLPDHWQHRWPEHNGAVWYRIDWQVDCLHAESPIALTVDRMVLAGAVYANKDLLWRDRHLQEPLSRSWNLPRYTLLPTSSLHTGLNHIWVRVHGITTQTPGLGKVHLGDPLLLHQAHAQRWWDLRTLSFANLMVSGVLGTLFLCAWLLRRSHTVYGWYAFNCACWVLFTANILATEAWPFPSTMAMARANLLLFVLFCFSYCLFSWRYGGQQFPRVERLLYGVTGLSSAYAALAPDTPLTVAAPPITLLFLLIALANTLQLPWHAWRTRKSTDMVFALCMLVSMAAGLHDMALLLVGTSGPPLIPYTALLTMLALSIMLGREVTRNMQRIEDFNQELTDSVAQACDELSHTLEREHQLALRHSRLQERMRLTHDLHDSLGGALVRSIAYVEQVQQPLANTQMLSMLKLMRDDLRQMIDHSTSTQAELPPTPIAWAAPLRHRFIALFDALDIQSHWLIPQHWSQSPSALQCLNLTRVAEEALTNVLKHSQATEVHIELLQPWPQTLLLRVRDNGVGFDVAAMHQHSLGVGMRSMRARLERFQGGLEIQSAPGATIVVAQLQLDATATTASAPAAAREHTLSAGPPSQ